MPSQLFKNVVKTAKDNENLNTDLANIFKAIEGSAVGFASEDDIKGLFEDVDTTSNRLGGTVAEKNKRLANILTGIAGINFGNFQNNDIDAFGDAYESIIFILFAGFLPVYSVQFSYSFYFIFQGFSGSFSCRF